MDKLQLLKNNFHEEMLEIYKKTKSEAKYTPSLFLQMVNEKGGRDAAKQLIITQTEGFTKLWKLGRLDLSVEAYVLKEEYTELFTDQEREICVKRLKYSGYTVK